MDKFIIPFVDEIKNYALDGYYKEFSIRTKPDGSVVTDIDVLVEKKIIKILKKEFPDDSILGEETGLTKGVNDITWVIDPIDGTRAFSQHKPEWGVLVSRIVKNDISTGIVICPVQDIYTAVHNNKHRSLKEFTIFQVNTSQLLGFRVDKGQNNKTFLSEK